MREISKISENLFEKIRSRFEDVRLGDENAETTSDASKARFFNFNYVSSDGEDFGNVTISVIDENNLKIYFSKNISLKLDEDQKKEWYAFLYDLRKFARRNLMSFDTRDISRSNLNIKDVRNVSRTDKGFGVKDVNMTTESRLYGTTKTSFENVGSARIRIVHTESVNHEVRGSRARHINAIYVENSQGERFRMQHNKLSGARAMARHVAEGGVPHDEVGQHISGIVQEMSDLGVFVRGMRRRTFEDAVSSAMIQASIDHYSNMHRQLNNLRGHRAYHTFVENFEPQAQQLDEVDVNELKERFVKKIFDDRMTAALPYVHKAYQLKEQAQQAQIQAVKDIIGGKIPLQLVTNEGMDEYMKMLSFNDADAMVVSVLEDIAARAASMPEVSRFAKHWASNWNGINEDDDQHIRENKALAVKLATQYIRDLGRLRESTELRTTVQAESHDDRGADLLDEGTWALPDTQDEIRQLVRLLSQPLQVGVDATNATSALYDLIGDDELFDRLGDLAEAEGPEADARDTVAHFLEEQMPGLFAKLGLGDTQELDQAPAQPKQPADAAPESNTESINRLLKLSGIQSFLVN